MAFALGERGEVSGVASAYVASVWTASTLFGDLLPRGRDAPRGEARGGEPCPPPPLAPGERPCMAIWARAGSQSSPRHDMDESRRSLPGLPEERIASW